jgi:hypothetical protein
MQFRPKQEKIDGNTTENKVQIKRKRKEKEIMSENDKCAD